LDINESILNQLEVKNKLTGKSLVIKYVIIAVAMVVPLYHIYVLGFKPTIPWIFYTIHVSTAIILIISIYPMRKNHSFFDKLVDLILILLMIFSSIYLITQMNDLTNRMGTSPTNWDVFAAGILIILILETTRRTSGLILPILALCFILYAKFGGYLPGMLGHRGYNWGRIIGYLSGFDGIFSSPISATANFVFIFIIFGSFLGSSGAGKFFINFALGVAGGKRGGPAKAGVFASALMGTVSGTSVSNVVTTGAFTIPLMKKIGYSPRFSGALESVASTGGQIMPPILGSAAFIMASLTGIAYLDIVAASVLPALLFFVAVYIMVDLEAAKTGLHGLDKNKIPNPIKILRKQGFLIAPLLVLIFILTILKSSPNKAALWAILTVLLVSFFSKSTFMTPVKIFGALVNSSTSAMGIISACATAGIIIGILNLTGVGLKFASLIISFSGNNLSIALVLTMIACLILGMGLPTAASYVITASVMAPALVEMGVPLLAAHMFVFYFACLSAITPPVALAAFAGAGVAKAKPMEVAFTSVKLGIAAFIVPFMFAYNPTLLLKGSILEIIISTITSLIGTFALASAVQGWLLGDRINMLLRALLLSSSIILIKSGLVSDIIGLVIIAVVIVTIQKNKIKDNK
jgi:TRAP transporter 4TM/12TM fusion protein